MSADCRAVEWGVTVGYVEAMDIYIALVLSMTIWLAVGALVGRLLRRFSGPANPDRAPSKRLWISGESLPGMVMSLGILLGLLSLFFAKDHLFWARYLPFSAAIVWSNTTALFMIVAAVGALYLPNRPKWRLWLSFVALFLLGAMAWLQPLVLPILRPIAGGDSWAVGNVCIQSRTTTCSAAAAATLLKAHDIHVTEQELVELCLTDARGTPSLGLWRGLKLATQNTKLQPCVITSDIDQLLNEGPWPCVLAVGLPRYRVDPIYVDRYGWDPGFRHSVVLFGRKPDGYLDIGDPSIGRESWSEEDLRILWRGDGVYLSKRAGL